MADEKKKPDPKIAVLEAQLLKQSEDLKTANKQVRVVTKEARSHQSAREIAEARVRKLTTNPKQLPPAQARRLTPAQQAAAAAQPLEQPVEDTELKEQELVLAIESTLYKQMLAGGLKPEDVDIDELLHSIKDPSEVAGKLQTIKLQKEVANQRTELDQLTKPTKDPEEEETQSPTTPALKIDIGGVGSTEEEADLHSKRLEKQYKISYEMANEKRGVDAAEAFLMAVHEDDEKSSLVHSKVKGSGLPPE